MGGSERWWSPGGVAAWASREDGGGQVEFKQQRWAAYGKRGVLLEAVQALELTGADRTGLLSEVFAVLADMECSVVVARAWTHRGRLACVAFVRGEDADAGRMPRILARLGHLLRGDPAEPYSVLVSAPGRPSRTTSCRDVYGRLRLRLWMAREQGPYTMKKNIEIVDPYLASYGAANPIFAVIQLAQTTMRSELGKMTLDKTFEERDALNENIVRAINEAATDWGLKCLRYEIKDISPPNGVKAAMEMQVEAERKKRAQILESEGKKRAQILESEGEAGAVLALAEASTRGIRLVSEAMTTKGSAEAATLRVAEQYVRAFSQVAKKGNTILLPGDGGNPSSFVATAFKIYQRLQANSPQVEELEESGGETETSEMPPLIPDIDPEKSLHSGKNKA